HGLWRDEAEKVISDIATEFTEIFVQEYRSLMGRRLGLHDPKQSDFSDLVDPLLSMMSQHHLDFSRTFRLLAQFTRTDSPHFDRLAEMLCPKTLVPQYLQDSYEEEWKEWFHTYQARLEESEESAGKSVDNRRERIKAANPRFILRQWILEEAISRLEKDSDVAFLQRVLDMANRPFDDYGEEEVDPA
ncbi:MAG: hypothetical protein CYPHOPRED_004877, partial [Cyphobasidiales sp. Tagirdzhanova-0007]